MIAIPNMDKPKSCYLCTFRIIDPTDGSVCGCVVGHNIQGIPLDQDRADDCPLIEIDKETEHHILNLWEYAKDMGVNMEQAREELTIKEIVTCGECNDATLDAIDKAPAILEAEEE